jgi:homocysteine S-methyltransferase
MIQKGWSVMAQLDYPEVLKDLHEDYIRAGASAIITNTFAAGRHMLEPAGLGSRIGEAHHRAVEIAIAARDAVEEPVVIAGSVSTYMADPHDSFWLDRLEDTYREQVELLAESGVDVIALEMMENTELAGPAVEAALASGLPVWLGLSARRSDDVLLTSYRDGDLDFAATANDLIDESLAAVFVMHTPCSEISRALEVIDHLWHGPTGVYPEAGYYQEPYWHFVDSVSPEELVDFADDWVRQGATLLGGCCGFGVEHIAALATHLT